MTIKELVSVIKCDKFYISYEGYVNELVTADRLQMAAYGNFIVDCAEFSVCNDQTHCEISVKTAFARKVV